LYYFSVD